MNLNNKKEKKITDYSKNKIIKSVKAYGIKPKLLRSETIVNFFIREKNKWKNKLAFNIRI